jgi:hypothetical protein
MGRPYGTGPFIDAHPAPGYLLPSRLARLVLQLPLTAALTDNRQLTTDNCLYVAASYLLGRGLISDVSTGSNSKRGSSASAAKYAFVVFNQLASSRSGKSGL